MFLCLKVCGRTTNNILKKSMRKVLVTTISSPIPEKAATIQPQSTTGFGMRYGTPAVLLPVFPLIVRYAILIFSSLEMSSIR